MPYSHYVIKNCSLQDAESACPNRWSELTPAFPDMVRHCGHCNKKVYLCETEEQIEFYISVKFCIAVASPKANLNVEGNTPLSIPSVTNGAEPAKPNDNGIPSVDRSAPNVWRRPQPSDRVKERQLSDMPAPVRHPQKAEDSGIPAFLRKQKK
jgi:hypothetical protein